MNSTFDWGTPKENWCKLPHVLIDALPQIETLAEMKIVLYILRHTWGYQDHGVVDQYKRLTMDDFTNGRKDKNGERIDNGVGMSPVSIRDGIERAKDHGFIIVVEDNRDKARQRRYYALSGANLDGLLERISDPPVTPSGDQKLTPRGSTSDDQKLTPDDQKLTPRGSETDHRTKKDTDERYLEKDTKSSAAPAGSSFALPMPEKTEQQNVMILSNTLQTVGVGVTQFMIDNYMDMVEECGIHATVAGIQVAAENNKQHRMAYVKACIRSAGQGKSTSGKKQTAAACTLVEQADKAFYLAGGTIVDAGPKYQFTERKVKPGTGRMDPKTCKYIEEVYLDEEPAAETQKAA